MTEPTDSEIASAFAEFEERLLESQREMPLEAVVILRENLWSLYAD